MQIWQKLCHMRIFSIYSSLVYMRSFRFWKNQYFKLRALDIFIFEKMGKKLISNDFRMQKFCLWELFWDIICNISNHHGTDLQIPEIEKFRMLVWLRKDSLIMQIFKKWLFSARGLTRLCRFCTKNQIDSWRDISRDS